MENKNNAIVSVGEWMVISLIMLVPIVNIIMLFVWAFSTNEPASKSNWAKSSLIWLLILLVFYIFVGIVFGAAFLAMADSF